MSKLAKVDKIYNAIVENGEALTAKQIATRYDVANPSRMIHYLRSEGIDIDTVKTTNSKGQTKFKYIY